MHTNRMCTLSQAILQLNLSLCISISNLLSLSPTTSKVLIIHSAKTHIRNNHFRFYNNTCLHKN